MSKIADLEVTEVTLILRSPLTKEGWWEVRQIQFMGLLWNVFSVEKVEREDSNPDELREELEIWLEPARDVLPDAEVVAVAGAAVIGGPRA